MGELPKKGDLIAGKYTVEGVLGQGGMGAVYEVCHRLTGKHFAVKWLLPALTGQTDAVRRFMREAQVAGRVDHPNVVEVYDVGQEGGSFYMVMELLQGEPLARRLDRVRRLSLEEVCRVILPVMHGLSVAHAAGVIHRDLKPDNIYLCKTPLGTEVSKVLDFGISKMSSLAGEISASVTRFGLVIGTPQYMSPEQLRGEPVDLRTDIYALGVILYEALGGSQPYPGANFADLVLTIATADPKPLGQLAPGLPPKLLDLVGRAMSRDPNQRFESVEQMGRALAALSGGIEFAADTGDPARVSMTQQRTPSSERLRTPFSTELEQPRARVSTGDIDLGRPPTLPMIAGVGVAATAVLALGVAAFMLMRSPETKSTTTVTPSTTTSSTTTTPDPPSRPPVSQDVVKPDLPGTGTELPVTNTVRIDQAQQGTDPLRDPRTWHQTEPTGTVDPAGLNDDPHDPRTSPIRLGPGRASHSGFGSVSERPSRRGGKKGKSDARREDDDPPEPRDDPRQIQKSFRSMDRGQGMTPDDF
ncbi:MAG TPA: serine/threonine-protein kinase [Polyangiales bacterium]|nr:serine/threonine-protein kinase [Polyangiales bacterium]